MSDWTYIRGCMELSCSPYENNYKVPEPFPWRSNLSEEEKETYRKWAKEWRKHLYLPYPEEQFKISTPIMLNRYKTPKKKDKSDDNEYVLHVEEADVYSLPKARKYLDEAFKLLEQGECGFRYAVKQDRYDSSSGTFCSSEFDEPCLSKYYKDAINKLYKYDGYWHGWTFDSLVKYQKLDKACNVNNINSMVIGIVESLRWCIAPQLEAGLEKFFQYLRDHDFDIYNVYLEWWDNLDGLTYKCTCNGRFDVDNLVFEHINDDGKVVYRKTYYYPQDKHGYIDWNSPDYDEKHPLVKEERFED